MSQKLILFYTLRQIGFAVKKNEVHGLILELRAKNSLKLPPKKHCFVTFSAKPVDKSRLVRFL